MSKSNNKSTPIDVVLTELSFYLAQTSVWLKSPGAIVRMWKDSIKLDKQKLKELQQRVKDAIEKAKELDSSSVDKE